MNSLSLAIRAVAFAAAVNLTPAAAQTTVSATNTASPTPQTAYGAPAQAGYAAPAQTATGTPHWEWQYHYGGRHTRYEGHWVWVR